MQQQGCDPSTRCLLLLLVLQYLQLYKAPRTLKTVCGGLGSRNTGTRAGWRMTLVDTDSARLLRDQNFYTDNLRFSDPLYTLLLPRRNCLLFIINACIKLKIILTKRDKVLVVNYNLLSKNLLKHHKSNKYNISEYVWKLNSNNNNSNNNNIDNINNW